MSSELKPCPFCGGKAISSGEYIGQDLVGNKFYKAYAGCSNERCGIGFELSYIGDTPSGHTSRDLERRAIAKWNMRMSDE